MKKYKAYYQSWGNKIAKFDDQNLVRINDLTRERNN